MYVLQKFVHRRYSPPNSMEKSNFALSFHPREIEIEFKKKKSKYDKCLYKLDKLNIERIKKKVVARGK